MKQAWGRSRWCYKCNQWQIIIIVVLFLSLSTYGIIKLTEDPYRTIMGPVCDLPRAPKPEMSVWYHTTYDGIPLRYYYRSVRAESTYTDTSATWFDWDSTTGGGWR